MTGLFLILGAIFIFPFISRRIEANLELFLFLMGIAAVLVSDMLSKELLQKIFLNDMLYLVTGAVMVTGLLFMYTVDELRNHINTWMRYFPFPLIIFLIIVVLGLISSIITAIVASLVLVEIVNILPLTRYNKVRLTVVVCFAIGLGAVLSPVGEPLATIVVSRMEGDFFYLIRLLGKYVIPAVILLGIYGALTVGLDKRLINRGRALEFSRESAGEILLRAAKVFIFIIALELLGNGLKPVIEIYIVPMSGTTLYWVNIVSAVLDNATLAAAEISPYISAEKLAAVLMGLLISGGMMIQGNIPNIIASAKMGISSREWAACGIPVGLTLLMIYFFILFVI